MDIVQTDLECDGAGLWNQSPHEQTSTSESFSTQYSHSISNHLTNPDTVATTLWSTSYNEPTEPRMSPTQEKFMTQSPDFDPVSTSLYSQSLHKPAEPNMTPTQEKFQTSYSDSYSLSDHHVLTDSFAKSMWNQGFQKSIEPNITSTRENVTTLAPTSDYDSISIPINSGAKTLCSQPFHETTDLNMAPTIEKFQIPLTPQPCEEVNDENVESDYNQDVLKFLEIEYKDGKDLQKIGQHEAINDSKKIEDVKDNERVLDDENCNVQEEDLKISDGKIHTCADCNLRFKKKCSLKEHIQGFHLKMRPHHCPQCDYKSLRNGDLQRHIITHKTEKELFCEFCDFQTKAIHYLKNHIKAIHSDLPKEKNVKCNMCNFVSDKQSLLNRHVKRVHLKLKPFSCTQCDYKCGIKHDLEYHKKRVHLRIYDHMCQLCDYKTYASQPLRLHIEGVHLKLKRFSCDICGLSVSSKKALIRHGQRRHTTDFPHKCDHCSFETAVESDLRLHIRTKHLELLQTHLLAQSSMEPDVSEGSSKNETSPSTDLDS